MPKRKFGASSSKGPSQPTSKGKGSGAKKGKSKGKGSPKGKSRKSRATPRLIGNSDDSPWADWQGTAAAINSTWWDQSQSGTSWGPGSWSSTRQTAGWHQRSTKGKGQGKGVDYCPPIPQDIAAHGVDNSFWQPQQPGAKVHCFACRDKYGVHPEQSN